MYEKFTDRARKVMQLANQEAQRFNHEYIGTEHILLGLVKEGSGVAANVLKNLDIDLRKIWLEVEKIVQSGPDMVTMGKLPQTPRAKKVIEYAIEEARNFKHDYVGTEHLLLGLIREEEGVASQVLMNLGLSLTAIRDEVLQILGHNLDDASKPASAPEKPVQSKTPALDSFGRDLTELARGGKLAPLIGRKSEIEQLLLVLTCRSRNNPLLVGASGAGKKTLIEGLAQISVRDNWPEALRDRRIVALNLARTALGLIDRGKFDEWLKATFNEIRRAQNIVLFLEDFSTWISPQATIAGVRVLALLSSALAQGEMQCIGTITPHGYSTSVQEDSLLARHFQSVLVKSPTREEMLEILRVHRVSLESHHRVEVREDALEAAIDESELNSTDYALPGKAIQLLDQACALVRLTKGPRPPETADIERQIEQFNIEKEQLVAAKDFEAAVEMRDRVDRLKKRLQSLVSQWQESVPEVYGVVDRATIAEVVEKLYPRLSSEC
jgi:ATP-dependent Clp protease ATP-binding subunit ClpC